MQNCPDVGVTHDAYLSGQIDQLIPLRYFPKPDARLRSAGNNSKHPFNLDSPSFVAERLARLQHTQRTDRTLTCWVRNQASFLFCPRFFLRLNADLACPSNTSTLPAPAVDPVNQATSTPSASSASGNVTCEMLWPTVPPVPPVLPTILGEDSTAFSATTASSLAQIQCA